MFGSVDDSPRNGADTILKFAAGLDRIDLRGIDADPDRAGDQAFALIGQNRFTRENGR